MKASLTTFFLLGFAIILTLPAEAQRGGSHTGGFSGRGGASGASRGFSGATGHGMSSRSVGVPSRPGGFSGRPPVVLIRPPLRSRPIGRVISPGVGLLPAPVCESVLLPLLSVGGAVFRGAPSSGIFPGATRRGATDGRGARWRVIYGVGRIPASWRTRSARGTSAAAADFAAVEGRLNVWLN